MKEAVNNSTVWILHNCWGPPPPPCSGCLCRGEATGGADDGPSADRGTSRPHAVMSVHHYRSTSLHTDTTKSLQINSTPHRYYYIITDQHHSTTQIPKYIMADQHHCTYCRYHSASLCTNRTPHGYQQNTLPVTVSKNKYQQFIT
jgi:hypothetical protein